MDYLGAVAAAPPTKLASYVRVKSSEAISFTPNGDGIVVVAEGLNQKLRLYPKVGSPSVGK